VLTSGMFNRLVRLFAYLIEAMVIQKDKLTLNMKRENSMNGCPPTPKASAGSAKSPP